MQEECHKSFGSLIEQASYLIIDDKKVIVQKEEAFSEYQTGKVNISNIFKYFNYFQIFQVFSNISDCELRKI